MITPRLASMLLLSTALVAVPGLAHAQASTTDTPEAAGDLPPQDDETGDAEAPDISVPGGAIIVTGRRRDPNVQRVSTEVVSVLSSEEIARTGEGDIAGALSRVTGLSVVGNGYVYVRGLGDRYSLALLNGSPLPSPEPLKRVVPLDIFPTNVIASSLVQKSYSVNFPGEFGGGVINLTTKAIPEESFLQIGGGISGDTETTGKLSYSYYGGKADWTGFDNGSRDLPATLQQYFNGDTALLTSGTDTNRQIASSIVNANNAIVQRIGKTAPNFSADVTAGTAFDLGASRLGVIAAAGYSHSWNTRDAMRQVALDPNATVFQRDQREVLSNEHILVNGMLGLGFEFGENTIRWTNLYIRDTIKQASLAYGINEGSATAGTTPFLNQHTGWYERQLIDTQIVGEFKPEDSTTITVRAGYANSQREAPYEFDFEYVDQNGTFLNKLDRTDGYATATFSDLNEDLWSAGGDVTHRFSDSVSATIGYAFLNQMRDSSRRQLEFRNLNSNSTAEGFSGLRIDELLSWPVINLYPTMQDLFNQGYINSNTLSQFPNIVLQEVAGQGAQFSASLLNHAWYSKIDAQLTSDLNIDAGVRWEWAREATNVVPVSAASVTPDPTEIKRSYWLPAATLTWQIQPDLQLRISASKTLGRPQFRELEYTPYYDPDSGRTYKGNPRLIDTQIYNAEARIEWYLNRSDHLSLGGFYKQLDNPIENYVDAAGTINTANAPKADLYGAELEIQKYFDVFTTRRILIGANYTWSKSKLKVSASDTTLISGQTEVVPATDYFRDGAQLTGQSEHMANLQFGLEDQDSLSQQTFLINYASKRVIARGNAQIPYDTFEYPGFTLDFVARQGVTLAGNELEFKFQARNITGKKHEEYQDLPGGRVEFNTYDVGRSFSLSASIKF